MPKSRTRTAPRETPSERKLRDTKARLQLRLLEAQERILDRRERPQADRIRRRHGSGLEAGGGGPAERVIKTAGLGASYPSTKRDRLKDDRSEVLAPADLHLDQTTLDKLRRDAHHLYRANPLARGMVGRICDAVAGPQGPNLVLATKDREWARKASKLFWKWANNEAGPQGRFDALGRQNLMTFVRGIPAAWLLDGDLAVVRQTNGSVRIFEGAEIRTPYTVGDTRVAAGVEFDAAGAPSAIYVAPAAPRKTYGGVKATRIPWEAVTLISNPTHRRMNQTRGEPGLAASAQHLELIDDALDSTTLAYRMATYAAMVLALKDPGSFRGSAIAQTAAIDGASNPSRTGAPEEIEWNPGSVMTLREGETVTQITPEHPTTNLDSFVRLLVRYACADPGCPLELAMLDSSETNYHGFKSAVGNAYRGFAWQQYTIGEHLTSLTTWRLALWILDGTLDGAPDDWDEISWKFQGPPIIAPKEEIEAAAMGVAQRLKTRETALQELGSIIEVEQFDEIVQREQQRLTRLGIEAEAMAGSPNQKPASASPTDPNAPTPKQGPKP